jgi:hypothetical protein
VRGLHGVQEARLRAEPDHQVDRLRHLVAEHLHVRAHHLAQPLRRLAAQRLRGDRRARTVGAVLGLHGEVTVDEHREQPVRRRPRDAELGRHVRDADLTGVAQHLQNAQSVVDRLDRVRRLVLHSRILADSAEMAFTLL